MEYSLIDFKIKDSIGYITINNPKSLNALKVEFFKELQDILQQCKEDDACRALIFTGAGEKAFSAGADIHMFLEYRKKTLGGKILSRVGHNVFRLLEELGKPSIAAINGLALGGGCELALACTFRIGSENARLGLTEITVGLIPGWGGTQRLSRLVGKPKALEMILSGEIVDAAQAHAIGLLCKVVPQQNLIMECEALARKIIKNSPLAVRLAMEAVNLGMESTLEAGQAIEANLAGYACSSDDALEGTTAFFEKRKPVFKGQ